MLKTASVDAFDPDKVMAQMPVNGEERTTLERVVLAGTKTMFDPRTHKLILSQLQKASGPMPDRVGQGIAGLLGVLWSESKGSLPPKLMIPAGVVLLAHAVKFLREAGMQFGAVELSRAMVVMAQTVLKSAGLDPAKVAAAGSKGVA